MEDMNNKVVLYGETHTEITDMLADKVRVANEQDKEKAKRVYLNWIAFVNSLKAEGLCGLVAENIR